MEGVNSHWRHTARTRGWAHVTHFDNSDYKISAGLIERVLTDYGQVSHLLDRCSVFVESIQLADCNRFDVVGLLDMCPRVERIAISLETIDADLVDHLRKRDVRGDRAPLRLEFHRPSRHYITPVYLETSHSASLPTSSQVMP